MLVFRVATEFFAKIHKTAMVGNVLTWGFRDRVYTSSSAPPALADGRHFCAANGGRGNVHDVLHGCYAAHPRRQVAPTQANPSSN